MSSPRRRTLITSPHRPAALLALGLSFACGRELAKTASFSGTCLLPSTLAEAPASLQETDCFGEKGEPASNLRAYSVNAASWSSGAGKGRWLMLAPGAAMRLASDGTFTLPPGSGVFKHFAVGQTLVETRLMLTDSAGTTAGVSYVWNDAQTQATLSANGGKVQVAGQTWTVPTRQNCMTCHNGIAGNYLGLRAEQVEGTEAAGAGPDTLASWIADGSVIDDANGVRPAPWPDPFGDAAPAERARSYLATNCSFCHQPKAPSNTATDYRFTTPLEGMGICGTSPTRGNLGIAGAKLFSPGHPEQSVLLARIKSEDAATMMPPIGRTSADTAGAALIEAWIAATATCAGR